LKIFHSGVKDNPDASRNPPQSLKINWTIDEHSGEHAFGKLLTQFPSFSPAQQTAFIVVTLS
jgi:hypothetical protein